MTESRNNLTITNNNNNLNTSDSNQNKIESLSDDDDDNDCGMFVLKEANTNLLQVSNFSLATAFEKLFCDSSSIDSVDFEDCLIPEDTWLDPDPDSNRNVGSSLLMAATAQPANSDDALKFTAESLINENKSLLQKNQDLMEQNRTGSSQCIELQKKVTKLEEEQIKQTSTYNDKCCDLEAKLAKTQMQAEQSEAAKQSLECDITSIKKKAHESNRTNKQKLGTLSKDILLLSDNKINLEEKVEILQHELESAQQANTQTGSQLRSFEEEKVLLNESKRKKNDQIRSLNQMMNEIAESKVELERELMDHQQTIMQRDQQIVKIREALESSRAREKNLNDIIVDLERNSKDLEQSLAGKDVLEEAVSSQKIGFFKAINELQVANQKAKDFEAQLKVEKQKVALITSKLEKSLGTQAEKEQTLNELINSKERLVQHSTITFQDYQKQYAALQQEVIDTRKHMKELNDSFVDSMCEIYELVNTYDVENFSKDDIPGRKCSSSPLKLCPAEKNSLVKDYKVFIGKLRTILQTYNHKSAGLKEELDGLSEKYKEAHHERRRSRELAESRGRALEEVQSKLKCSNERLLEIQTEHHRFEASAQATSSDVVRMSQDLTTHVQKCSQLQNDLETMQFRHGEELETQENFLRELYLVLSNKDGETASINNVHGINQLSVALREKLDRFIALYEKVAKKTYNVERSKSTLEKEMSSLQMEHKESIDRFADECRSRESQSIEYRKQLEEHFQAYVQELQSKVQHVQALNDEAWARVNSSESVSSRLQDQLDDVQENNATLQKHRRSLASGCCILLGLFYPMLRARDELGDQRQLLTRLLNNEEENRIQLRKMLNTLDSELNCQSKQVSTATSFKTIHPLIRFRVAVVAVLAMNRLKRLSARSMFSCHESSLSNKMIVAYTGKSNSSGNTDLVEWLTSDEKITHAISIATEEIVELLQDNKCNDKKLEDASKKAFVKIVHWSRSYFDRFTDQRDNRYRSPLSRQRDDTLVGRLRFGLYHVIRMNQIGDVIESFSSKNSVSMLRKHFLSFTKRLHESEVQRLRLNNENSKLLHQVESHQTELSCVRGSLIELQKVESSKKSSLVQCSELSQELSCALDREKTSQELLQEQNSKIKDLKGRMKKVCNEGNKNVDTLNEAVSDLTDARLELKRNAHTIRQFEKKVERLTNEKDEVEKTVQQAKHALKKAVGERSTITAYFTNVGKTLENARSRDISTELQIHNDALVQHGGQGLKVATRTVDKFIRAQTGAVQRINHLETQLTSYKNHINNLKKEFHNCCLREKTYHKNVPPTRDTALPTASNKIDEASSFNDFSPLVPEMSVISSCDDTRTNPSYYK